MISKLDRLINTQRFHVLQYNWISFFGLSWSSGWLRRTSAVSSYWRRLAAGRCHVVRIRLCQTGLPGCVHQDTALFILDQQDNRYQQWRWATMKFALVNTTDVNMLLYSMPVSCICIYNVSHLRCILYANLLIAHRNHLYLFYNFEMCVYMLCALFLLYYRMI